MIDFAPHNMTNWALPVPFVVSNSSSVGGRPGFYAFDDSTGGDFWGSGGTTGWVELDVGLGNTRLLTNYDVKAPYATASDTSPMDWTMEGSNDEAAWDVLDTVAGQAGWANNEIRSFVCDVATTAYRYFRLNVSANNGDPNYLRVGELYLYMADPVLATPARDTQDVVEYAAANLPAGARATQDVIEWAMPMLAATPARDTQDVIEYAQAAPATLDRYTQGVIEVAWVFVAPAANPPSVTQGSRRMSVLIPNRYDNCLDRLAAAYNARAPYRYCCPLRAYREINQVRAPADALPFRKTAAVPTPLAATGDVVVLAFQVPCGYDGVIAGLWHLYTGPGFGEGDGDIEWRLMVNRVYATRLGRVLVTLGSRALSYPVDGGIPVQSGNLVQYIVAVPNLSGGILPLASQIVCGVEGLFYARA
jgi:hypothetical protein